MPDNRYDIIIIGGGATGSGIALDASSRGFRTLLVEKGDFASGTSSKSTKLIHGGVRYLEAAVKKLDINQFNLVKEGLKERDTLLKNAPHLCSKLKLITPLYKWWEIPYMFMGLSLYDFISGKRGLGRSLVVSKEYLSKNFPHIKKDGLKGGVKYYDGSFNDAKLNIALLKTAKKHGAVCKNYHKVKGFLYEDNKIVGIKVKDMISGEKFKYYAKVVINATGMFSDKVRKLDDKNAQKLLNLSSGVHVVLDKKYLPSDEGLMVPKTKDGRVLFILPWMGKCLVGTTDEKATLKDGLGVSDGEIEYILEHLKIYFDLKISKDDILSSWKGLRPLVAPKKDANSSAIVRDHLITKSPSNLISIIGGKWTTYRKMSQECVDFALNNSTLPHANCKTENLKLIGSENLQKNYSFKGVDYDIITYLAKMYGNKIEDILKLKAKRLHANYAYTDAELIYCLKEEFVKKPLDFIVRRTSLALIDKKAAKEILPKVADIMAKEFNWSESEKKEQEDEAKAKLESYI